MTSIKKVEREIAQKAKGQRKRQRKLERRKQATDKGRYSGQELEKK